jgi:PAS domain S-box-containing protein
MRIKAKLLWMILGMCLLAAVVGSRAINRQRAEGILQATNEAEEDARVLAFIVAADHDPARAISKKISRYMLALGRNVEVVDTHKRVIVDSVPAAVGGPSEDTGDALDQTMRDGRVRTFLVPSAGGSPDARRIVAPVIGESGQMLGAVTEDYTPIYNEFMAMTETTTRQVVVGSLAGVVIAVLLALNIGTSIARPLRQLTRAAVGFAAGQTGLPMPPPRNDEIGDLTVAFQVMMEKRQEAEAAQSEAAKAVAVANANLMQEVADRSFAEEMARQGEERVRQLAGDLALERERFSDILNSVPAMVFEHWSMVESKRNFVNSYVETMYGYTAEEWLSTPDFWLQRVHPEDKGLISEDASAVFAGQPRSTGNKQFRTLTRDNRVVWNEAHFALVRDPANGKRGVRGFVLDITEQKRAEDELKKAHEQLIEASREAGMAEVATNVLHNVGNVLNSVNVSASVAAELVRQSSIPHLGRAAALLEQNAGNLGGYLANDPVGQKLPAFLGQLAGQLEIERGAILKELEQLAKNVEHIKDIVSVQQSYASAAGMSQTAAVVDMVEDSLRMNAGALTRHDVQLVREYECTPVIKVDKHKVMQILVNLIRNAKYACDESGRPDKRLTVRIAGEENTVRISVIDNGVGIPAENLTRIFSHGFTTRKEGHGFGLHSGAIAAREIGGALLVHSDGPGRGATFTLNLPLESSKS